MTCELGRGLATSIRKLAVFTHGPCGHAEACQSISGDERPPVSEI